MYSTYFVYEGTRRTVQRVHGAHCYALNYLTLPGRSPDARSFRKFLYGLRLGVLARQAR